MTNQTQSTIEELLNKNVGKNGLKIERLFTDPNNNLLNKIKYEKRTSQITNEAGKVIHEQHDVEVPEFWSQVATDVLAQKYFRKRGVPIKAIETIDRIDDEQIVEFSSYLERFGKSSDDMLEDEKTGENSIKQVAHRLAGTWTYWAKKYAYFDTMEDARNFYLELKYMLIAQICAPNSPQWFNTGLNWAYGISGSSQGHYYIDPITKKLELSKDSYSRPQPHACFIQGVEDDLLNEDGIFHLLSKEARIFKYGSGTGTNFSKIRSKGEKLSGGGTSSGLMSFLSIFDKAAGGIKSGGTTRRAAKMVCLDMDHPDIVEFITWKVKEERKVASLVAGSQINYLILKDIANIYEASNAKREDILSNNDFHNAIAKAKVNFVPLNYIKRILMKIDNGMKANDFKYETFDTDFRSESYTTVDGQNSNNSVRISNDFMNAVLNNSDWNLINRVDGKVAKTVKAKDLWDIIAESAWESADPGLQFDTTINEWHTCPNGGRINASNPCSEYMFLDETACNLASINLDKFYDSTTNTFDIAKYTHTIRLWTIVLEIAVLMAQLPGAKMAELTYKYRTLGLGYANLGTILMKMGIAYNSTESMNITALLTSIMTGVSYTTSSEMAKVLGSFEEFVNNRTEMLRVIKNHKAAANNGEYDGLTIKPLSIDKSISPKYLYDTSVIYWDMALKLGELYGFRNAQVTVIAPTGTIGLIMDCDTTGIEPDFSLIKYKKLVGGGYFKLVNTSVNVALENLKYSASERETIMKYIDVNSMIEGAPFIKNEHLSIFDTANKNGEKGKRFIEPMGHVNILAAAQPFVSGSISKTINLPEICTIEDIKNVYMQSWKLGLKCNAIYRDSSKLSQPLNTGADNPDIYTKILNHNYTKVNDSVKKSVDTSTEIDSNARLAKRIKLPIDRDSMTHKFQMGGHEGYITVGLYENGTPGEIFIQMNKEGSTLSGIMDAWAVTMSLGLQYGVPIETLIKKFVHVKFDPAGMTGNPDIPISKSIVDYLGRWLALKFLPKDSAYLYHNHELVDRFFEKKANKLKNTKIDVSQNLEVADDIDHTDQINIFKKDTEYQKITKENVYDFMKMNNQDSPACHECGAVMIRNGACYKCLECGTTSGCS